jgi:hypothetical protein
MPDAGRALGFVRLCCALRPWHRDGFQREPGGANMKHTKEQREAYKAAIDAVFKLVGTLGDGPEHEAAQQACDALLVLRYGPVYPGAQVCA